MIQTGYNDGVLCWNRKFNADMISEERYEKSVRIFWICIGFVKWGRWVEQLQVNSYIKKGILYGILASMESIYGSNIWKDGK